MKLGFHGLLIGKKVFSGRYECFCRPLCLFLAVAKNDFGGR